jgi:hypothetical protein
MRLIRAIDMDGHQHAAGAALTRRPVFFQRDKSQLPLIRCRRGRDSICPLHYILENEHLSRNPLLHKELRATIHYRSHTVPTRLVTPGIGQYVGQSCEVPRSHKRLPLPLFDYAVGLRHYEAMPRVATCSLLYPFRSQLGRATDFQSVRTVCKSLWHND